MIESEMMCTHTEPTRDEELCFLLNKRSGGHLSGDRGDVRG